MSHRIRTYAPTETPIERIFEKVMRRKMTSQERIYFHLKRRIKPPPRVSVSGQSRAA
jgi:transposase